MLHIVESRKSTHELARDFPAAASRHKFGVQMRAMDTARFEKRYGRLSRETLEHVADAIPDALGVRCDKR